MNVDSNNTSFRFILVRKGGNNLYKTRNIENLPLINVNSKSNDNKPYNKVDLNKPFISGIENSNSSPKEYTSRKIDYKAYNDRNCLYDIDKTSISFGDATPPHLGSKRNILNGLYNLKLCSSSKGDESDINRSPINLNNPLNSNENSDMSNLNKSTKPKRIKNLNTILKDKKFLIENYLAMNKNKKMCITKFSKAEREICKDPKKENKFPILTKDIYTKNLENKNKEIKYQRIKLIPYLINEKYYKDKLGSSMDRASYIKKIDLKAKFGMKPPKEINGDNSNTFLFRLINSQLNTYRHMNDISNEV